MKYSPRGSNHAVPPKDQAALAELISDARAAKGLTLERLAEISERRIRLEAAQMRDAMRPATRGAMTASAIARMGAHLEAWESVRVTRHHVSALEGGMKRPLGTMERRARLLAVVLALGLDRGLVNQLAGGI